MSAENPARPLPRPADGTIQELSDGFPAMRLSLRPLLALAALLALALAGCGPAVVRPPSLTGAGGVWQPLIGTMPAVASPASANVCGVGSPACIADVVAEMTRRLEVLEAHCSHEAPFALLYLDVTRGVAVQGAQRFRNREFLNHLDAIFANLYFTAYDNWQAGQTSRVPDAWRIAFEAADRGTATVLGDMLLGMNAHISRDLPFALARTGLREPDGQSGQDDFNRVNGLLGSVTPEVLREESERFDPTLTSTVLPLIQLDPSSLQQLLGAWRGESWHNAERLLTAHTPAQRARVARTIELGAAGRARLISSLTSDLVIGPDAAQRNAYCERRRLRHTGLSAASSGRLPEAAASSRIRSIAEAAGIMRALAPTRPGSAAITLRAGGVGERARTTMSSRTTASASSGINATPTPAATSPWTVW